MPNARARILVLLVSFAFFAPRLAHAQVATGTPPFGSFGGGPDIINLANLNAHLTIPVLHKPGRGTNFTYDLSYDTSVWYPVTSGTTTSWQPVTNWGWRGQTEPSTGYISFNATVVFCYTNRIPSGSRITLTNWQYHDTFGVTHSFSGTAVQRGGTCGTYNTDFSAITPDGSGYTLMTDVANTPPADIYSTAGKVVLSPANGTSGPGSAVDRNGNEITVNGSGQFFDTLNATTPVLTVAGTGTPTSPLTFTYNPPTGSAVSYTMKYAAHTVQTAFGCSGVSEYGPTATNLVSEIDLPDGSKYTFSYETTHNDTHTPHYVTGRLASVTLPTGGTISYAYSTGGTGINGISCADGSALTLVRQTPDGTWNYAQVKGAGAASTTTVTDPYSNDTVLQFQNIYETQRQSYQGSHTGGTLLQTINTCYNGAASPCTATAIALPIAQRAVIGNLSGPGNKTSEHIDKWNTYGQPTESDDYAYGSGTPGSVLKKTLITYASLGTTLNAFRQSVAIQDGSGTVQYRQDSNYDQYLSFTGPMCISGAPQHDDANFSCSFTARGNLTSITTYTNPAAPSGGITKSLTYDSLGNLRSQQADCCQLEQWNFSSTNGYAYPDSIASGTGTTQFTTSYTYDPNMGAVLTSTDPNGVVTTSTYDYFARPSSVQVASNPAVTYNYTDSSPSWSAKVCTPVTTSTSVCQNTIFDSQGRPATQQTLDKGSTVYSAVDTSYDKFGRAYKTSNPYTGSGTSYCTETDFDPLGRVSQTVAPDNSKTIYTPTDDTVTIADPTGKQRVLQYDPLGRLVNVTEPDPLNGNSLTLQTGYTYTVLDALASVTQGSQTRSYNYDALGRLLSTVTPEAGTTCFGSVTGSTCNADGYDNWGNLLKRTDARGALTTYGYDGINRLTSITYNLTNAPNVQATANVSFGYDSGGATAHALGQLTSMNDGVGSETYSYNALEQLSQIAKVVGANTYTTQYAYNLAGEVTQLTYPSGRVVAQNYDAIGRLCSVGASGSACASGTLYASGFGYNPAMQVTGFKYGNPVYASYGFSSDRLQMTCLDYSTTNRNGTCVHDGTTKFGLTYSYGAAGSNNGQIAGITDSVDNGRSATYSYDSLNRLSTAVTVGSSGYPKWGLSWSYDRYGNVFAENQTAGSPPHFSVTVSATTNQISGAPYLYDSAGNLTNDGNNTLKYDAENRVVSASNGGTAGTYAYDGNGLRIQKVSGGTTTVTIFSGGQDIAEYVNTLTPGSPTNEYIYAGSTQIMSVQGGTTRYLHNDHLSLRFRTDTGGNLTDPRGTYPFGETWYSPAGSPWMFTSYFRDIESVNDYALARSYVNRLNRFSSPDPLAGSITNPQSLNRFSYVSNDPINLLDPSGMCDVVIAGIASQTGQAGTENETLFADSISADLVFPYPGSGVFSGVLNVASQGSTGVPDAATATALAALNDAVRQTPSDQQVNIFAFSGGAQAFSTAMLYASPEVRSRIGNVTYLSPGLVGPAAQGTGQTIVSQNGWNTADPYISAGGFTVGNIPQFTSLGCSSHGSNCSYYMLERLLQSRAGSACKDRKTLSAGKTGSGLLATLNQTLPWWMQTMNSFLNWIDNIPVGSPIEVVSHRLLGPDEL